jgi:hypothetical protein
MVNRRVGSSTARGEGASGSSSPGDIARRLEQVRKQQPGELDLKGFWREVRAKGEELGRKRDVPSYASVRLYHEDRTPPIAYLVLVSQAFGVSLEWLATGQTAEEETAFHLLQERIPELQELDSNVTAGLLSVGFHLYQAHNAFGKPRGNLDSLDWATEAWKWFDAPIDAVVGEDGWLLGIQSTPWRFSRYAEAMIHAFLLATDIAMQSAPLQQPLLFEEESDDGE